ncbi:hypothetical protein [Gynuella sp.]|uniref:hypothetical protein n=1 Tax=Gynuella sp. TaxID=2969146 RepID=UPI003D0A4ACF
MTGGCLEVLWTAPLKRLPYTDGDHPGYFINNLFRQPAPLSPEAVSYNQIAETLSHHLGKVIQHKRLSIVDLAKRLREIGYPED